MKKIRESQFSKILAYYFSITIISQIVSPTCAYALTDGPTQPEFSSFTPISTSDMVDLSSGDFNYNIPIMDVGGYPINLSYNSGISMDQESSWVGLGWNLNVGQIDRNVRGLPDDFDGDLIETKNNIKDNITVGAQGYVNPQLIGALDGLKLGAGLSLQYNNYTGYSCTPSYGLSFSLNKNVSVGMQLSSSVDSGVSVSPSVSISTNELDSKGKTNTYCGNFSAGINYNSRQGLSSFNMNASLNQMRSFPTKHLKDNGNNSFSMSDSNTTSSVSSNLSFINTVFSPTKRTRYNNASGTISFSAGPDLWGLHAELSMSAFASVQTIADKARADKAFGYENTEKGGLNDILDFSREKEEGQISKNTLVLSVPVYNHDILTIQGQGINGMFRPYRSKVGGLYTGYVKDGSWSFNASGEVEGGVGFHGGGGFKYTNVDSYSGLWDTNVSPYFISENTNRNAIDYEKFYYKIVGERNVDKEYTLLQNKVGTNEPIAVKLDGAGLTNSYLKKDNGFSTFNSEIKRKNRLIRNKNIQKISANQASLYNLKEKFIFINNNASSHHTSGYIITELGGNKYIYGNTVYNKAKYEVSYSTDKNLDGSNFNKGIIPYDYNEDTQTNHAGIDHYFNEIKTPAYATSYLLSSILSNDYSDLTNNGPTDDDLGSYTKFTYSKGNEYKWRVPYTGVSYNKGLNGDKKDQKGSFLYGEKELKYISKIETKTHIAFFDLEDRNDALGTIGRGGGAGAGSAKMKYIKSIRLYAKSELQNGEDPGVNALIKPIKTAYFEYDYSLCKGVENHANAYSVGENGKLTLKKVYFTYRGSNLGKYAAYEFNYNSYNPNYNPKSYDIWGNYKENEVSNLAELETKNTPQDFPYVKQDKAQQDLWSSSWTLTSIKLPSGGVIQIDYEADDYQYVQNQRAMKMMKVVGVVSNKDQNTFSTTLYGANEAKYVVVKVDESVKNQSNEKIKKLYTDGLIGKPIFFNFYLNLVGNIKDNVQGYFEMSEEATVKLINTEKYLYVPMKYVHEEGKKDKPGQNRNPISVAGWFFGRKFMNHQVYTGGQLNNNPVNILNIAKSLLSNVGQMAEIISGANGILRSKQCASSFTPEKSWIRLYEPTGTKFGGGCRVKKIELYDNWDQMLGVNANDPDINRYKKKYGQEYTYKLDNGTSSGVATYEPNSSKENTLVQPFYHNAEKLSGQMYQETPFGESFFPAPTITYSQVAVRSTEPLADQDNSSNAVTTNFIKSGKVITKHYTSFDFPTITDNTSLADSNLMRFETNENKFSAMSLASFLGINIINTHSDLTMSQGFSIITNDMNGKVKEQLVYNESNDLISSVKYKYATSNDKPNLLDNNLLVIDEKGIVSKKVIGETTEVYNDFNTSNSKSTTTGGNVNIDVIPIFIPIVIGYAVPERSVHRQTLKTATTTKIIHKTGILVETIATDLGSTVSTKNLAWDANTGDVLLTQTINEFDDTYYSFNYPAYWHYSNMAASSKNTDITLKINSTAFPENGKNYFSVANLSQGSNLKDFVTVGDQIYNLSNGNKYWVYGFNNAENKILLMDDNGNFINSIGTLQNQLFKIVFSGFKNLQTDMMASVTMMKSPLVMPTNTSLGYINQELIEYYQNEQNNAGIINASAVEYSNNWKSVCENNLPNKNNLIPTSETPVNPYKYNLLGIWRPIKSYAYLTGRNSSSEARIRKSGYFTSFNPFYKYENNQWIVNKTNWTFASEVTRYLPHGVEIENKDALNRYSSAQYGYGYKLPMAVTSNAQYKEMGFDGFEDYQLENYSTASTLIPHFGFTDAVSNSNPITKEKSHTGRNSIKVSSGSNVQIKRKIGECTKNNSSN